MTIADIFAQSALPRLETEIFVSFLLQKNREFLLTHPETPINKATHKKFLILSRKRQDNWPVAYLTGQKEFYGLKFKVTPAVLVPRPETEMMVEEIIDIVKKDKQQHVTSTIVDIGTGSGAIIIAVVSELKKLKNDIFKNSEFKASDISAPALKVAKQNAIKHKLSSKIKFYRGNLLQAFKFKQNQLNKKHLIIAANLPYLTSTQINKSPGINHEPRLALDGSKQGFKYYRELFKQLKELNLNEVKISLICEIDPSQNISGQKIAKLYFPTANIISKKDLRKKYRFLVISI
ncbi:peptide chain release factor N(5)-glutamine methyltransferase [Candidatus Falkowbacteria bacterium]|uniref:Peptide chain release factor N(5)-glutamine methyltransferase n=1 Tax=Candidatus Falkowbacteria bacterium CG10_big_fil_rev_8_21_14_0_10_37_18 TaxID=1974562 RepID=A0A2H0V8K2_9BACT|nr:peptide chain release factor N(5)-glutamine methyltransferase [Candidatus Falkowbacteria bacterium]NCQ12908.1 peptide chain release factor N(5)-glutamine methyltransferase [Candidatus Falkowbacteria bacterium]OIO06355.1 MAG: protein-(glutamine-N5) methyltransferase, release factor-specific [Candidatus Falkowbacteria bacterium CG1_02_37_21]PIR95401.1 MAG: peptide chain release factor N(5)-glutamine methyltransferase [Candidatus Falkowbacteria bacterium CG10_big_fil_rev_8_21_14_0_10_37_18]